MSIEGRVALITGAGQGIGRGIAERLAKDGATIAIADLNEETAAGTVADIVAAGGKALSVVMDVSQEASVNQAVEKVVAEVGPVSILVNNAGIFRDTPGLEVPLKEWDFNLAVMLTGPLLCARATAPGMIEQRWGRIINMASLMSFVAFGRDAGYCTTKTGLLGLTRSLAADLAPHNVLVNAICPGNIMTPMLEETGRLVEIRDGMEPGSFIRDRANDIPLGRLGQPEDIAKMASFLCSDDADYITGQSLHVNGGLYNT